jgi:hypothetical protein
VADFSGHQNKKGKKERWDDDNNSRQSGILLFILFFFWRESYRYQRSSRGFCVCPAESKSQGFFFFSNLGFLTAEASMFKFRAKIFENKRSAAGSFDFAVAVVAELLEKRGHGNLKDRLHLLFFFEPGVPHC